MNATFTKGSYLSFHISFLIFPSDSSLRGIFVWRSLMVLHSILSAIV